MAKRLVLNAKLDTSHADLLRSELMEAHGQDVALDASQVELCGALCSELLLCAHHLWEQEKKSLRIENATSEMIENLSTMGLSLDDFETGEAA